MGVFLSLFLIVIVNFRSGESINELKLETQKIASDIRKVQTLALTGSNYNGDSIGMGGYGIKFGAGTFTYMMFNDENGDGVYTAGEINDGDILETRSLANDIDSLELGSSPDGMYTVYDDFHIVFKPYSSEISIMANGEVLNEEVVIRIRHARATGKTGVITAVPVSGKIDFRME